MPLPASSRRNRASQWRHLLLTPSLLPAPIAVATLVAPPALTAQIVENGVITGVVKDETGAGIASVNVLLHNTRTGLASKATTNAQGLYVSSPLKPGEYDVVVEVPGFNRTVQHTRLEVGQRLGADVVLKAGGVTETVEVQSAPSVLQTENSSVSNLRTEEAVKDLPLNSRNFAELIGLGAGTVPALPQFTGVPYVMQRGVTTFALNGLRYQENRLLLDGIGDNDNHNGLSVVIYPPIDAIQEFSEDIADADARYGRGNGGTVNLVFKSGTNRYHGSAFDFFRNTVLNARNYFATGAKPPLRQNQFGGTFGGPLLPFQKTPSTFFFADYAGRRMGQGQTSLTSVPDVGISAAGYDFSAYPAQIVNPRTHLPYAANFVPATDSSIDPVGLNILKFYRQYASPNVSGATIANNHLYNPLFIDNSDAFDIRVDHRLSDLDSAFARYSHSIDHLLEPGILPTPLVGASISGPAENPANQLVLSETHILTPTVVNTLRFGWSRFFVYAQAFNTGANLPTQLGIPGVLISGNPLSDGLPVYSFTGYTSIGDTGNSPSTIGTNNYQTDDNVTLLRGKHSLDIGFEFVRLQYNMFQTGAEHGSEAFGTRYSGLPWSDLLFGAPVSGTYSFPSGVGLRQGDLAFYVQDNFRVSNRLTLNLGVRYENFLGWPWTEVNNKEYDFVPSISTTALEQVGTHGIPRSGLGGNNLNFAPRLGFAYRATGSTVVHAGFGTYYSAPNVTNSSGLSANVPVNNYWAFNNSTTFGAVSGVTPFVYTSNGFAHTVVTSGDAIVANTPALAQDPNARTPYSEQWHATVEQQVPFSTVLKFAYVGTRGVHLDHLRDINAGQLGLNGATTVSASRPYPFFAQINELETHQVSTYHSLQITAERRARGLGFLASYTYSHALDDSTTSPGSVTNPYNIAYDYGNSDMNLPSRLVASANYNLPFQRAGRLNALVQGWQLSAVAQIANGYPFSVISSTPVGDNLTPRAQRVAGTGNGALASGKRTLTQWFNTAAFANPAAGTWGNTGRNILTGPGTKNLDFSVFKNNRIREGTSLQLRAEFFNLTNTPHFNNPGTTVGAATFGRISSAGNEPLFQRLERQVQLAAKLTF